MLKRDCHYCDIGEVWDELPVCSDCLIRLLQKTGAEDWDEFLAVMEKELNDV